MKKCMCFGTFWMTNPNCHAPIKLIEPTWLLLFAAVVQLNGLTVLRRLRPHYTMNLHQVLSGKKSCTESCNEVEGFIWVVAGSVLSVLRYCICRQNQRRRRRWRLIGSHDDSCLDVNNWGLLNWLQKMRSIFFLVQILRIPMWTVRSNN